MKDAWAMYEKHRADHPALYPEEEAEAAPKDLQRRKYRSRRSCRIMKEQV